MAAMGRQIKMKGPRHLNRSLKNATTTITIDVPVIYLTAQDEIPTSKYSSWDVRWDCRGYLNWMEQREEA